MVDKSEYNTDILTLTRFLIVQQQKKLEETNILPSGDFTLLMQSIQMACKFISSKVRKAGITNLYGLAGETNATGDSQKKLDVLSDEVFISALRSCHKVCAMCTEEQEKEIICEENKMGKYVVCFDPLDGSSNIDANVSIGSIFAIWKRKTPIGSAVQPEDFMQGGDDIISAGYCLYGSSTQMVIATKGQVNGFTLDPAIGEFILTHPQMKCPKRGVIYSANEGNSSSWEQPMVEYVKQKKFPPEGKKQYSLRYIGSMVADVHRTLLYGGIFLYPSDIKSPQGKLRVLYECFPMAFVCEQAGGKAITGRERILSIKPTKIHQRCGVIIGSAEDVEEVEALYKIMLEQQAKQQ